MGYHRGERRERTARLVARRVRLLGRMGRVTAQPHRYADVHRFCVRNCRYCGVHGAQRAVRRLERGLLLEPEELLGLSAGDASRCRHPRTRRKLRRL